MNNPSVAEVIAAFRRDRINAAYILQQKVESLPEMKLLKSRKKILLQKILDGSLRDTEDGSFLSELEDIEQQEKNIESTCPVVHQDCMVCNDTGFLNGKLCGCLRDKIYHEVYGAINISELIESFETSNLSLFNTNSIGSGGYSQSKMYAGNEKWAREYAEKFPNTKKINVFLTGNTGLGKTYILRSMAKTVHKNGEDVMLIGASELFSVFHRHRLGYDVELSFLQNCSLLLIDDLGVEPATQNVTKEYFLDLLNKRIDSKKSTVIASNLSTDNIVARYGERVYSRIRFKEICHQLIFEGVDIRLA